jgi:hypothetical protein
METQTLQSSEFRRGWQSTQQLRLVAESKILQKYFPSFRWINPNRPGETSLVGSMHTNDENRYIISLKIPPDFPNSFPKALVKEPYPLIGFLGKNMTDFVTSSSMHLLCPINGYPQICHHSKSHWTPNKTIYDVLMKIRIWLEAFELYRTSGKSIDHFLRH